MASLQRTINAVWACMVVALAVSCDDRPNRAIDATIVDDDGFHRWLREDASMEAYGVWSTMGVVVGAGRLTSGSTNQVVVAMNYQGHEGQIPVGGSWLFSLGENRSVERAAELPAGSVTVGVTGESSAIGVLRRMREWPFGSGPPWEQGRWSVDRLNGMLEVEWTREVGDLGHAVGSLAYTGVEDDWVLLRQIAERLEVLRLNRSGEEVVSVFKRVWGSRIGIAVIGGKGLVLAFDSTDGRVVVTEFGAKFVVNEQRDVASACVPYAGDCDGESCYFVGQTEGSGGQDSKMCLLAGTGQTTKLNIIGGLWGVSVVGGSVLVGGSRWSDARKKEWGGFQTIGFVALIGAAGDIGWKRDLMGWRMVQGVIKRDDRMIVGGSNLGILDGYGHVEPSVCGEVGSCADGLPDTSDDCSPVNGACINLPWE